MAKMTKLSEPARRQLAKIIGRRAGRAEQDQVTVVVLGPHEGLVSRLNLRGRKVSSRELRLRLAGAELAVDGLVMDPPAARVPQLAAGEAALLDEAGLPEQASGVGALERSRIELEALLHESLTIAEAARFLQVSTGRLRQRLARRTLYGVKEGRSWRLPRFQLDQRGKLVRGIDKVLPYVRPDAHPLAVSLWFTSPHQDLVIGDDEAQASPRQWLRAGRPPEAVARLADEI
jgi:excisionase family DNA binding protein